MQRKKNVLQFGIITIEDGNIHLSGIISQVIPPQKTKSSDRA